MKTKKLFALSGSLFLLFALYTAALARIDVQPIGPEGSRVGFAALNRAVHEALGVHLGLYTLTDWLSLAALVPMAGFALLGLWQLLRRKSLFKVDASLLVLGGFYLLVLGLYLFFEVWALNYRPVLIEGYLEASYPSSTTLLVLCVAPTTILQLRRRLRSPALQAGAGLAIGGFGAAMAVGRLVSGVHWFTDILGSLLLGAALVALYQAAVLFFEERLAPKALKRRPLPRTKNAKDRPFRQAAGRGDLAYLFTPPLAAGLPPGKA